MLLAYYTAYTGKLYGPLANSKSFVTHDANQATIIPAKARVMWIPMISLMIITLVMLWITGDGDLRQGSGSLSVFTAVVSALVLLILFIGGYKLLSVKDFTQGFIKGTKNMLPAVTILVLSFAFGTAVKILGTGLYVSSLISPEFPIILIAPIIFLAAGLMAFSTGTSWGTFALLIPIAVPIALTTGIPVPFLIAAVLSGGVFGDHASPISDSTVVASIASGCDHFEHVKTQLPYALFAAALTIIGFIIVGALL